MRRSILALLLLVSPAWAQKVALPPEVKTQPGVWTVVVPLSKEGGEVKWKVGEGLTLVDVGALFPGQKPAGVVVHGPTGRYQIWAWCAKGDVASDLAVCTVVIGDAPPTPPGPTPPIPPGPTPGPVANMRVLIIEESSERAKLPASQVAALFSKTVHDKLDALCAPLPGHATQKHWIITDQDTDLATYSKPLEELGKRKRDSLPWIVIAGDGGVTHEGPLPKTVADTMALLEKYAPKSQLKKAG